MKKAVAVVALESFLAILLFGVFAIAGTPHEKGVAAVAVNRAIVEVGAEVPELKDTTDRFFHSVPVAVEEVPVSAIQDLNNLPHFSVAYMNEHDKAVEENRRCVQELDSLRAELAEAKEKILEQAYTIAELKVGIAATKAIGPGGLPDVPLPANEEVIYEPIQLRCHTADGKPGETWCLPCNSYHNANHNGDARMEITYTTGPLNVRENGKDRPAKLPSTTWIDSKGKLRCIEGFNSLDGLWSIISNPDNDPPVRKVHK